MRSLRVLFALAVAAAAVSAGTVSYTGVLSSPASSTDFVITLPSAGPVIMQTFGFGGGTNAAGAVIAEGGTNPFLAIFAGTGSGAAILTDGSGNPFGTSLTLTNYESFAGCPPAGAPVIGGAAQCGDITMAVALAAGIYTVVLSDGQYVANAVYSNGTLGEGFTDFTGGSFCNALINDAECPNRSGAYALDITTPGGGTVVPEPASTELLFTGTIGLALHQALRRRRFGCNR